LPDNFRFFVVNTSWLATTYCKWMGIINTCLDLDGEIWAASLGFFYGQDAPSFLVSVLWFSRFEFSYVSHEFTEKPSLNLSDIHRMRTQLQYIYIYIYIYCWIKNPFHRKIPVQMRNQQGSTNRNNRLH